MYKPVLKRDPEDQKGVKVFTPEEIKKFCEDNTEYQYDLETIEEFRVEQVEEDKENNDV